MGTYFASLFDAKAKKWVKGRLHIFERLEKSIPPNEKIIWVHCASLGEFEQSKPIIEKLHHQYPAYKILLTFFSPSGYEAQKNNKAADWVFYLPMDGPGNAKRFLEIIHPSLVIFVKYEFWYYYLKKIKYRNIPVLLVSALFRDDMSFFKWYGGLQRKMLGRFNHLFVQNTSSKQLMDKIGLTENCTISGDTRFDRVIKLASEWKAIPLIEQFIGNSNSIIAGSTWPEDEEVLQKAFSAMNNPSLKLIIAPHDISEKHINEIEKLFPSCLRFSRLSTSNIENTNTLIIDNIGLLSTLYKYASITYVGGGLRAMGVHNVLEAAVYNKVVLFGEYYEKYAEAIGLVGSGGGISFSDPNKNGMKLKDLLERLLKDKTEYDARSRAAGNFIELNKGATQKIMDYIQENRLLTI